MFKKIPAVKTAVITIAVFVAVSSFFIIDLTVVNSYADTTVKTAVVKKGPLRIRRGPGTDYKICGLLAKGNAIGITDISGSWYKIISRTRKKRSVCHSHNACALRRRDPPHHAPGPKIGRAHV